MNYKIITIQDYQLFLYKALYNPFGFEVDSFSHNESRYNYKLGCMNVRKYSEPLENYLKKHNIRFVVEEL